MIRGPISVIGNTRSATAANCQLRKSIRMMPAINSKNGSAAELAKPLIVPSKADMSTENRDRISPRLVRWKNAAGKFWTCSNIRVRTSEISDAASRASNLSYQIATIEVMIPATASTERIRTNASKSSSPSASSIRNFRLSGMITLNSVSTRTPSPTNAISFL